MKKLIGTLLAAVFTVTAVFAQTPEEILARMDRETARFDKEGFIMVMEVKIPILGTFATTAYFADDNYKMVLDVKGKKAYTWSDGVTEWMYDESRNELHISSSKPSEETEAESNSKMLKGITKGYDVTLQKETADAWYFLCTKSKTNQDKDDPKKMDLAVSKATYLPISLKTSVKGIGVTMRDFAVGVKAEDIAFNQADYADATVIDKRGE